MDDNFAFTPPQMRTSRTRRASNPLLSPGLSRKNVDVKRILLIYTGGTIGMFRSPRGLEPRKGFLTQYLKKMPMYHDTETVEELKRFEETSPDKIEESSLDNTLEELREIIETKRDLEAHQPQNPDYALPPDILIPPKLQSGTRVLVHMYEYVPLLDSSNIRLKEWSQIATDIHRNYHMYDGFVVLHGTDTMSWTATALSFFFRKSWEACGSNGKPNSNFFSS